MTNSPSVVPSPALVDVWLSQPDYTIRGVINKAAQWGADAELEACCEWLGGCGCNSYGRELRAARRPKPPSLKEQALTVLEDANLDAAHYNTILRALEQLPND